MSSENKIVYLMRGLPGCGKSNRARRLAGDAGVVVEADRYFYTEVGSDPQEYSYREELLPACQEWSFEQFTRVIEQGISPVVVDRGNALHPETRRYAVHAVEHGYAVEIAEPDSLWWQEIRVLLKYKKYVDDEIFDRWAQELSRTTRNTQQVDPAIIRMRVDHWRDNLQVQDILDLDVD